MSQDSVGVRFASQDFLASRTSHRQLRDPGRVLPRVPGPRLGVAPQYSFVSQDSNCIRSMPQDL
eukprot:12797761-Alexandrium_andersonii.AAC.1